MYIRIYSVYITHATVLSGQNHRVDRSITLQEPKSESDAVRTHLKARENRQLAHGVRIAHHSVGPGTHGPELAVREQRQLLQKQKQSTQVPGHGRVNKGVGWGSVSMCRGLSRLLPYRARELEALVI